MAGVEVCSRPPQLKKAQASSSGNMAAAVQQTGDTEQAGSVEQLAPPVKHPGRLWKQDLPAARRSTFSAPQRLSSGSQLPVAFCHT